MDNTRGSHSSGDQVFMSLIRLENTVNENNEMLRRLVNKNKSNYGETDLEDLIPVPIQDDLEWEELQTRLKNTDFSKKLVLFLAALGGSSIGETVRKICRRLALNNQWSKFSLKAENKKKSLQAETSLINFDKPQIICDSCLLRGPLSMQTTVRYNFQHTYLGLASPEVGWEFDNN
ncbi:unnamed protein product [Mytilus edulis]|uniref:Uncharacterized protein n=1 Tax=Mytilus edulis TaxID=6550 RepID=A0A8S3RIB9_MYTED|nr:unnamed protein product [Mytilus edulis]